MTKHMMASSCSTVDISHSFRLGGPPSNIPLQARPGSSNFSNMANIERCTCIGASATINLCHYCQTRTSTTVYSQGSPNGNQLNLSAPPQSLAFQSQISEGQAARHTGDDNYDKVRSHFSYLKREITVESIIDALTCLSSDNIDDIKVKKRARKKMEVLLKRVLFIGEEACKEFISALEPNGWKHCWNEVHKDNSRNRATEIQSYGINSQMLQNCYQIIVKKLPAEEVADMLVDYDVLTIDDHDIIMSKKLRNKMAEKLLKMMLSKSQQSLNVFIHVLQKAIPDAMHTLFQSPRIATEGIHVEVDSSGMMEVDTAPDMKFAMKLEITSPTGERLVSLESDLVNRLTAERVVQHFYTNTHTNMDVDAIMEGSVIIQLNPKSAKDLEKFKKVTNEKEFEEMLRQMLKDIQVPGSSKHDAGVVVKVTFSSISQKTSESEESVSKLLRRASTEHGRSIGENRAYLIEELNPLSLVHILNKSNILSESQVEWIKNKGKTDRRSQVEKLIQILLNSNDHAIREFKCSLEGTGQNHILEHITKQRCSACLCQRVENSHETLMENIETSTILAVLDRCIEKPQGLYQEVKRGVDGFHHFFEFLQVSKEGLIAFEDIMYATGEIELLEETSCKSCSGELKSMENEEYLVKLEENFDALIERIDATAIMEDLLVKEAITYSDKTDIMTQPSKILMNQLLLKKIVERGPKACVLFFGVLFDQSYEHILHPMKIVHPRGPTIKKTRTASNLLPSRRTSSNTLMVAAIDFGTTYSGVAYSLRKDFGKIPLFIDTLNWDRSGLISLKTPTSLLLDPSRKFAAFGYKAEEQYNELLDEDDHREWFYFKQFKMILHHQETLNRNTVLQDVNGHELPALEVFSHSIKYLKHQLHARLDEKGADVRDDDIYWILTVPAIWNDPAKQFMREAAENAAIPGEQLSLALEPEVASVYVKEMCVHRHESKGTAELQPFSPGTKYMVLDLGGGTVDITVREVLEDKTLKELHKATGSDWGGLSINRAFFNLLEELFDPKIFEEFKDKCKSDCYEFENDVEMKKRTIKPGQTTKVSLRCPSGLRKIYEAKKKHELKNVTFEGKGYAGKVDIKHDKLRLDPKLAESLFDRTADAVTKDVKEILSIKTMYGLRNIICVGGFAECDIFINKIKERLPNYIVMVPQDAGLAVLKGAVLYGQNPKIVTSRIIRYTYGNAVHRMFLGDYDPPEKFVSIDGQPYCKDVFNKLVEIETEYEVGGKITEEVMPLKADMTKMSVHLYRSKHKNPKYVTDKGCENLGTITVDMPDTTRGLNRKVLVSLTFGDTELIVEGKDETTGKSVSTSLDLLVEK